VDRISLVVLWATCDALAYGGLSRQNMATGILSNNESRQTDRQIDRQTDKTDRQTDRLVHSAPVTLLS
jgi:hypothetical protein